MNGNSLKRKGFSNRKKKKVHFSSEAYPTTIPPFILTDRNFNFMLGAIRHPGET